MAPYLRALALKPDHAEAHNNFGNVLLLGASAGAVSSYQRALALKPDYAEARNNLASRSRVRESRRRSGSVSARSPSSQTMPRPTTIWATRSGPGQLDDAVMSYQRALALKPDYAEAHNNLGTALKAQGKLGRRGAHTSARLLSSQTMLRPTTIWATRSRTRAAGRCGDELPARARP